MESPATTVIQPETQAIKPTTPAWAGWGKTTPAVPCSFHEVMSEELVKEIQASDQMNIGPELDFQSESFFDGANVDTSSDHAIAQMLQLQMDAEHDRQLKREENKWNGTSKVKVTYDKYKSVHPALQADADAEYDEFEAEEARVMKDQTPQFSRAGISGKGKNIVTKHDAFYCGKRNVKRVMENFPPEFVTGDDSGFDMSLPNHVYNQLKIHSTAENKRSNRLHEKKEHSTVEQAVDSKTRLILYKLVNNATLDEVNGIIASGKESVVFHAFGGNLPDEMVPAECAVKVFKTTLAEFKNRCLYIKGDVRFFKDELKKQNPRKIMKIWAEKEEINLRRMRRFNIPCPLPVVLKKHVLVMSFIGKDRVPAPTLKDAKLSVADLEIAYEQCVEHLKRLYGECNLVHADFSEYNLLWFEDTVYVIDVAQSVDKMHPHAMEFLLRDCANISDFFTKKGGAKVLDEFDLFNLVTGLNIKGKGDQFLSELNQFQKEASNDDLEMSKTDYPFDYFFEKTQRERLEKSTSEEDELNNEDENNSEGELDDNDNEADDDCEDPDSHGEVLGTEVNVDNDTGKLAGRSNPEIYKEGPVKESNTDNDNSQFGKNSIESS